MQQVLHTSRLELRPLEGRDVEALVALLARPAVARWWPGYDARGHHRLTIDPAADNVRAIGLYTRLGFRRVGVMRQYERGPDGRWHDGVLMELLADESSRR